jgi:pimeloyl-ACP methyl ester carboxylesterase
MEDEIHDRSVLVSPGGTGVPPVLTGRDGRDARAPCATRQVARQTVSRKVNTRSSLTTRSSPLLLNRHGLGLFLGLALAGCVSVPEIPRDIRKETHRLGTGGDSLTVDFYHRPGNKPRPLAVVVHGFLANKDRMAHWGVLLARAGFLVAVPTNPTYANDDRNVAAIVGLVKAGRGGAWPVAAATDGRVALVGFSRGGFETMLAAAELGDAVDTWVGLDPVDREGKGRAAAADVQVPGLALLADPAPLNANGNARGMFSAYGGKLEVVPVRGSGHLDAESPRRGGKFAEFARPVSEFLRRVFEM